MVVQVQKIGEEFVLPPHVVRELGLVDGSTVEVTRPEAVAHAVRYASVEETMKVHREMEPFHAAAYAELAK